MIFISLSEEELRMSQSTFRDQNSVDSKVAGNKLICLWKAIDILHCSCSILVGEREKQTERRREKRGGNINFDQN